MATPIAPVSRRSPLHGRRQARWIWPILLAATLATSDALAEELRGSMTIAGLGPERPAIEALAQAFEKTHLGTALDIKWNRNFRPVELVKTGDADLAIAGRDEPELTSTTVAWDGLAVVVNFSNPVKDLTRGQVAALFTGAIRDWSELDERAGGKVRLVVRPADQNLSDGFERSLDIVGHIPPGAERLRSDQQVLSRLSGRLDAVGYLSLNAALDAVTYGMSVRILLIDGTEPATATIQSGRYPLKRPVVFLTGKQPTPLTTAFLTFALSTTGQRLLQDLYIPLNR